MQASVLSVAADWSGFRHPSRVQTRAVVALEPCHDKPAFTSDEMGWELCRLGLLVCKDGRSAIAALLITAHVIFLLAPVALTPLLLKAQPRLQLSVRSYPLVIVSMFAFVLASVGEIAQHVFDNWLYIDSRVSTYNFVFYLMTTASNAMLAAGLGTSQIEAGLAIVSCSTTPASFVYAIIAEFGSLRSHTSLTSTSTLVSSLPHMPLVFSVPFKSCPPATRLGTC
ncbi:hypothetical protein WJX82_000382 [Trebouxia sp. C0006]